VYVYDQIAVSKQWGHDKIKPGSKILTVYEKEKIFLNQYQLPQKFHLSTKDSKQSFIHLINGTQTIQTLSFVGELWGYTVYLLGTLPFEQHPEPFLL
jgi:predicted DNA-binding protein YlxM (UPF0122 family)